MSANVGGGGLKVIVTVCRHAKLKANVLFNPSAMKKVGNNYSMLKEKNKKNESASEQQSDSLFTHS